MPVTMQDIADKAGLTQPYVSKILNGKEPNANPETVKKVLDIARKLNYRPNRMAQVLRSGRTQMIGVETGVNASFQFGHFYLSRIYQGISAVCKERKYKLLVDDFFNQPDSGQQLNQGRLVDGVIFVLISSELKLFKDRIGNELASTGIPFAVVHSLDEDLGCNSVGLDCRYGGRQAAEHLLKHGYTSLGFLYTEKTSSMLDNLSAGFKEGAGSTPVKDLKLKKGGYDGGFALGGELAKSGDVPQGIFVTDDSVAYGLIKGLTDGGVSVPGDTAVIGYGDQADQALIRTSLTTLEQPARKKGELAARMVLAQLDDPKKKSEFTLLKPELVIRSSCGCKKL